LREQLLENLLFFLDRPSVTGSEKRLCDDLAARISSSPVWEIERISNNLAIRRKEPDPSLPRVVLAGHLDTVPEPEGGIEVRVEGDRVYGRGASDMKSGDAVMLALLEGVAWEESRFEPVAVFAGSPWVLDAELALVPEPTAAALEVGCVGTAHVEVTFSGTSAHAARPWQGENALTGSGEFLAKLHERPAAETIVQGLTFYEVLTPTVAQGGRARNVVPDSFQINVNYRFAPGKDLEDVKRLFEELLRGSATYEVVDFAPSGPVNLDNPLLQELIDTGLEVRPKQAWTDVARFSERGVSAANFGPGLPSQAHKENEYAELPLLEECYTHLVSFFSISARSG
jgi:succinyl-diaminopimelate desuccinylase